MMATARLSKPEKIFLCRVATRQDLPDVCVKILFKPKQEKPLVLPLAVFYCLSA
jgi:hypothetical protein